MSKVKNVVLVVADSLRFNSVYQSPGIGMDYVEQNAVQFMQARSSGCWTLPATASIFTGKMPHQHGATSQSRRIDPNLPTLAEKLKSVGFKTYQVTANPVTTDIFGLDRGFDEVHKIWQSVPEKFSRAQQFLLLMGKPRLRRMLTSKDLIMNKLTADLEVSKTWLQLTHEDVFEKASRVIAQNEAKNERSFMFINLMETHFPYHVAPSFNFITPGFFGCFREAKSLFHTINQTFLRTGKLHVKGDMLKMLRQRQRKSWEIIAPAIDRFAQQMHQNKETLFIFCSDHGDNFGEDKWLYHFSNITDAGNKVPMFILPPNHSGKKIVDAPVNAKDIHATTTRLCQAEDSFSLLEQPKESISILQSYWYNNREKTLPQYKYNQLGFVDGEYRYMLRKGGWHVSPVSKNGIEPSFDLLPKDSNPIFDAVSDPGRQKAISQIVKDFEVFSKKITF